MTSAKQVLAVATSQLGYNGGGSTDSPDSKYGAWYGINPANWCAMFVSWCGDQAAKAAHSTNPFKGVESDKGFAYTPTGAAHYQGIGKWISKPQDLQPGDVVFWDYGLGRISHTGLCLAVSGDSYTTIEGNTWAADNGWNGNTCRSHVHAFSEGAWRGAGRPPYDGNSSPVNVPGAVPGTTPDAGNSTGAKIPLLSDFSIKDIGTLIPIALIVVIGLIIVFSTIGGD